MTSDVNNLRIQSTAYHEAGHVLMGWLLGLKIGEVAIDPIDMSGRSAIEETCEPAKELLVAMAGMTAQEAFELEVPHEMAWFGDCARIQTLLNYAFEDDDHLADQARMKLETACRDVFSQKEVRLCVSEIAERVLTDHKVSAEVLISILRRFPDLDVVGRQARGTLSSFGFPTPHS